MKVRYLFLSCFCAVCLLIISLNISFATPQLRVYPKAVWQRYSSPEEAGWSSPKLLLVQQYSESVGSAAVVFIHAGKIVTSWGDSSYKFKTHSIRKSFLNSLYGIHVKEGKIDITQTLADLGIDDLSPLSEMEKSAKVIDLLKTRSGVYHPSSYETSGMKNTRPKRGSHKPGSYYYYNNWDFNVLGTVFKQETGADIFVEFKKRIAIPLQMEHYQVSDGFYDLKKEFSRHPAFVFRMSALDMARYGLLYLSQGQWQNKQIISKEWVRLETDSYSKDHQGYDVGFKWQRVSYGELSDLGAYYTDGYRGQWIFVIPQINSVFVHRVNTYKKHGAVRQKQVETILKAIIAANPSFGIADPHLVNRSQMANSISENIIFAEAAELAEDVIYKKPSTEVLPEVAAVVGRWEGDWGKVLPSFLIIDSIDQHNITGTFGWGSYVPWKISKENFRFSAKTVFSDGRLKIEFNAKDTLFTFFLNKDQQTIEGYYKSVIIQMTKTFSPGYN